MNISVRRGFYSGLIAALLCALFLIWLWQPERQVRRHTEKFLYQIEARNWSKVSDLIDTTYLDQWGNDRARVTDRMREVMHYIRGLRIAAPQPTIKIRNRQATWIARIAVEGQPGEAMSLVKERINSLSAPFELEWRRQSAKPWDWKLMHVANSDLELPADLD